jgi:hypothetical protein
VRWLRVAAAVELLSLLVLLVNLATAHLPAIASLGGPTHGCAYLVVVVAALRSAAAGPATKAIAWVPGIGGLLVVRRLTRESEPGAVDGQHDVHVAPDRP